MADHSHSTTKHNEPNVLESGINDGKIVCSSVLQVPCQTWSWTNLCLILLVKNSQEKEKSCKCRTICILQAELEKSLHTIWCSFSTISLNISESSAGGIGGNEGNKKIEGRSGATILAWGLPDRPSVFLEYDPNTKLSLSWREGPPEIRR